MAENFSLFAPPERRPLAERLRPVSWEQFEQSESLEPGLLDQLKAGIGTPPSLVLWGPPGSGKTTFARLIQKSFAHLRNVELSAVLVGVKEVREVCEAGKATPTLLFFDEIHRFTKAQQDAFLPYIERGDITLIGATTENPSFYLNQALLSRVRVIQFQTLTDEHLDRLLIRAEELLGITMESDARLVLIHAADGDARKLLNSFEAISQSRLVKGKSVLSKDLIVTLLGDKKTFFYDRNGDEHYQTISAFIKSMRGSDPDAALFYAFKMIEAGEDPRFIIRRMMIFASEDIGNADPRALSVSVATAEAFDRIGLPEGKIPIAHCITYLATAPKSNRSYVAMHNALVAVNKHPRAAVPLHLRNAPTKLMKDLGHGRDYQYPHDDTDAYVAGIKYLPDEVSGPFYIPSARGYEKNVTELIRARITKKKD